MCNITEKEQKILDCLTSSVASVCAIRLGLSKSNIESTLTILRRKERRMEKNLKKLREYRGVLHAKRKYRGI